MSNSWTVVVPVKGTTRAKTRMAPGLDASQRTRLMTAFALDTVDALRRASRVAHVIVVTDAHSDLAGQLREAGTEIVADPGTGLNDAIAAGIAAAGAKLGGPPIAALLGDLPCLTAGDIDDALELAAQHPLALVPDAAGVGSTLITARSGIALVPHFGEGSAARHIAAGHTPLDIAPTSGLRTDVDTEPDLAAALTRGVGPHTQAALSDTAPD
ncbi:2-phospho-L-lactate guanylyltransferase [Herbiconiux sp.]|uniref:2-phospho-L-lactate guanylyltransferase n=1 Tax=Herbiconiux sp. TaxID=1871186 RepID=UPI0025BFB3C6|nr:2-phospho-L-lactate guanylyltransferase [Herbiconiux sp.]